MRLELKACPMTTAFASGCKRRRRDLDGEADLREFDAHVLHVAGDDKNLPPFRRGSVGCRFCPANLFVQNRRSAVPRSETSRTGLQTAMYLGRFTDST